MAALGHHSLAGTYSLDRHATIQGSLVEFTMRNPHSFLVVEVKDDSGRVQRWGIEWSGTSALQRTGVTSTTLRIGDPVVITGAPSKDAAETKLLMQRIVRSSDQWAWEGQVGNPPATTPLPDQFPIGR
jgi:hypothetical protein